MERLYKIGTVTPKSSLEVKQSRLGLGFEKLDRNTFDPNKAYDKVAALGVKWIRIQSGWQRTERQKGVYDFTWLDEIVDNLLSRGLRPWLCLCYGNDLYTEMAKTVYGAVGCPPIFSKKEKTAWKNYVQATVRHFAGRIFAYEIWNEPDADCWKSGVNGTEFGLFTRDTAKAIRETDPALTVYGGVICVGTLKFLNEALQTGMAGYLDAITYHQYTPDEQEIPKWVNAWLSLAKQYNPKIQLIQGESGSQSRSDGAGAMWGAAFTPRKQAKQLLRHAVMDLSTEVLFTSFFSCMDMKEALNGVVGDASTYKDYGYFGVLGADFDEDGFATGEYTPKPSYYALQNLSAIFSEDYEKCELPIFYRTEHSRRIWRETEPHTKVCDCAFRRPDGSALYAYWMPTELLTTDYESNITLEVATLPAPMRLVDPYDGSIYEIPESMIETDPFGCITVHALPIRDYPMFLTFGNFMK